MFSLTKKFTVVLILVFKIKNSILKMKYQIDILQYKKWVYDKIKLAVVAEMADHPVFIWL